MQTTNMERDRKIKTFHDLVVWQKAHALVLDVYRLTESFPDKERFGIVAQLRRSAASIPANIVEGYGRRTTKEWLQSLAIANGSLEETRYFLLLSHDLRYLKQEDQAGLNQQCDSVAQLMGGLARSLRNRVGEVHGARSTRNGAR